MQPETVTIQHPDHPAEPRVINREDYDPQVHRLFEPAAGGEGEDEGKRKGKKG